MLGSATVQLQKRKPEHGGDKFFIYIPSHLVEALELIPGVIVGIDLRKQGMAKERKRKPFQRKDAPDPAQSDASERQSSGSQPVGAQHKGSDSDLPDELQGMILQAKRYKVQGWTLDQLKETFEQNPYYSWLDIPENDRKDLER